MIALPQFDPVAFSVGPAAVRWYGLAYVAGVVYCLWAGGRLAKAGRSPMSADDFERMMTWGVLGILLGGRLGIVLFYQPDFYFSHPSEIFKVWKGGMSFHGGFLGSLLVCWLYCRRRGINPLAALDFIAPMAPVGLGLGRLANFVNGELWGRVTDPSAFWAVGFPSAEVADSLLAANAASVPEALRPGAEALAVYAQTGMLPRHPSTLYEFALEGVVLFALMAFFSKKRLLGFNSAMFLIFYGAFRFCAEFAREPDWYLGLRFLGMSRGQWLSVPMAAAGVALLLWSLKNKRPSPAAPDQAAPGASAPVPLSALGSRAASCGNAAKPGSDAPCRAAGSGKAPPKGGDQNARPRNGPTPSASNRNGDARSGLGPTGRPGPQGNGVTDPRARTAAPDGRADRAPSDQDGAGSRAQTDRSGAGSASGAALAASSPASASSPSHSSSSAPSGLARPGAGAGKKRRRRKKRPAAGNGGPNGAADAVRRSGDGPGAPKAAAKPARTEARAPRSQDRAQPKTGGASGSTGNGGGEPPQSNGRGKS